MKDETLLAVDDLRVSFFIDEGEVRAVDGVSFYLKRGETLGIVGESGSGKTVTNLALLGLIPRPPGRILGGKAMFDGLDLLQLTNKEYSRVRGRRIAMIFQDPMTALNPFLTVEEQLTEMTRLHLGHTRKQAIHHAISMLEKVGIPNPSHRVYEYPHMFSGGMRQRVMIAMALSCDPDILIADEPTTALDVTIQAQILELMNELQERTGTAIIFVTHDLGVVAQACHRVLVMYAGKIVEKADVGPLFARPRHPYTIGLMRSIPRLDEAVGSVLTPIPGQPPDMTDPPSGCSFHPRCDYCIDRCREESPELTSAPHGGMAACHVDIENIAENVEASHDG